MGPHGVRLIPLSQFDRQDTLLTLLRGNQSVRARVVSGGDQPVVLLGGQRIPLPKGPALVEGSTVTIRLVERDGARTLDIQTSNPPRATQAAPPLRTLQPLLQQLLATLDTRLAPDAAAAIVPQTPLPRAELEALFLLLSRRGEVGAEVARVIALLEAAVQSGHLPPDAPATLRRLAGTLDEGDAEAFLALVKSMRAATGKSLEALLAQAARSGGDAAQGLRGSLLAELLRLRDDASVREGLRAMGTLTEFRDIADGAVDRMQAGRWPNLHGRDGAYHFFEMPLPPNSEVSHAAVHLLGEDGAGGGEEGRRAHTVVLDLQFSRLGSLWIVLQSTGDACHCTMRVTDTRARDALAADAASLATAIESAGFERVQVTARAWDGDRLAAAAELFARRRGFKAEA